jgi:hypothetical protein
VGQVDMKKLLLLFLVINGVVAAGLGGMYLLAEN